MFVAPPVVVELNQCEVAARFVYHLALLGTGPRLKCVLGYCRRPHRHCVRQESGNLQCEDLALVSDGRGQGWHDRSWQAASTQGRLYSRGRLALWWVIMINIQKVVRAYVEVASGEEYLI